MKTLFFIAALAGAVYLIMQTPSGKTWLEDIKHGSQAKQILATEIKDSAHKKPQVSSEVLQSLESKISEFVLSNSQKQQVEMDKLQSRIAELENELVIGRINEKQQHSAFSPKVTLHPYKSLENQIVTQPSPQIFEQDTQTLDKPATTSDKQLQRNRQARLQDIAQKMEISSLQALVN